MRLRTRGRLATVFAAVLMTALIGAAPAHAAPAPPLEGIPSYSHVAVLTLENEDASTTFGPGSVATYLNGLLGQGTFLPSYYATSHVSLGNYITMMSGLPVNPSTTSDCLGVSLYTCVSTVTAEGTRHLGDQLDDAGKSWAGYMDGTASDCFHAAYVPGDTAGDPYQGNSQVAPGYDYADRHNPFIYFQDVVGNDARCAAHEHPFTRLASDIAADTVPAFSFITPDTCHDGHDAPCSPQVPQSADRAAGGLTSADAWLATNLPPVISYLTSHNGLLIINFDEGSPTNAGRETCSACTGAGLGGRTGALLLGAGVTKGVSVTTSYDHYSLLRTIEDALGISEHLGLANAATTTPMADAFAVAPVAAVPESPLPILAAVGALGLATAIIVRSRRRSRGIA